MNNTLTIALRQGAMYKICKDLDVSRDELARKMGVASTTAFRIDKGDSEPSPKFIAALMRVSGKAFEELFEVVEAAA